MTRYYSMRDVATVRYAIGISMLLQVLIGSSVMILGIGMRGMYPVPAVRPIRRRASWPRR